MALTRWAFVAIGGAALLLLAGTAGRILVIDAPQRSDVMVVLAGETGVRPAYALQLLRQGYARHVLLDVPANAKLYSFTQLQIAEAYVNSLPERASISVCPIAGLSTRDESRDVKTCLRTVNGTKVLVVTSDFHTRRALSIFRHEIPDRIFSVAAARDPREFGTLWWRHRQWAKTCFDEWLRLIWWNALERWN